MPVSHVEPIQGMRVLFIASRADIAGGERYLLSVMRHLDRRRYEPIVVLPGDGALRSELDAAQVEHLVLPANYWWLQPPQEWYPFLQNLPQRVRRLVEFIRSRGVALVHTNSNQILEGALAARLCGVPHVYLAHIEFQGDLPIYERVPLAPASFAGLMAELSSRVIAVSSGVAASLQPAVDPNCIQVIHNGLELAVFDQAVAERGDSFRKELGVRDGEVLVTAVGRLHPDKGFDVLVDAASMVRAAGIPARFAIVGGTDDEAYVAELRQRIDRTGLAQTVHLVPFRSDVPAVLAQSDVFVLSSRREGHPFVLLEAMACGCPAVATRCNGVEDTVVDGETGTIVPIGDAGAMATAIGELARDGDLRRRYGQAGFGRVRQQFAAERMVAALQAAYDDVLAEPPPRPGSIATDLFLQACTELGYLGGRVIKRAERAADLLLDNPVASALRRLRRGRKGG